MLYAFAIACLGTELNLVQRSQWSSTTNILQVEKRGETLFAAAGEGGFRIVDISNPDTPRLLSAYLGQGGTYHFAVVGARAFLAKDTNGVEVLDISDRSAPRKIGALTNIGTVLQIAATDKLVCIESSEGAFRTAQVDAVGGFTVLGRTNLYGFDLQILGQQAYLRQFKRLVTLNVADATRPYAIAVTNYSVTNHAVHFVTNYLDREFLALRAVGDRVIAADKNGFWDITDPSQLKIFCLPKGIGTVAIPDFDIADGRIFLTGNFAGFNGTTVLDVETGNIIGLAGCQQDPTSVSVDNGVVCMANGPSLDVFDGRLPALPQTRGTMPTAGTRISFDGDNAFATGPNFLECIDMCSPTAPVVLSHLELTNAVNEVAVGNGYAVVAGVFAGSGFWVVDVRDPLAMQVVGFGTTEPGSYTSDLRIFNNVLWLLQDDAGTKLYDLSDPSSPSLIKTIPGHVSRMTSDGARVYVATGASEVKVYDVSEPRSPALIQTLTAHGQANGVYASGSKLYMSDAGYGVRVFDVSDIARPREIALLPAFSPLEVAVDGRFAYVADGPNGLQVFDILNEARPVRVGGNRSFVATLIQKHGLNLYASGIILPFLSDSDLDVQLDIRESNAVEIGIVGKAGRFGYLQSSTDGFTWRDERTAFLYADRKVESISPAASPLMFRFVTR